MDLIAHEMAHLPAFRDLASEEDITEQVCLKFGETFDAAMTEEAWARLKGALDAMRRDHGEDHDIVKQCRVVEDPAEAEEVSQMKGARAAVLHPAGQMYICHPNALSRGPEVSDHLADGPINSSTPSCAFFCKRTR